MMSFGAFVELRQALREHLVAPVVPRSSRRESCRSESQRKPHTLAVQRQRGRDRAARRQRGEARDQIARRPQACLDAPARLVEPNHRRRETRRVEPRRALPSRGEDDRNLRRARRVASSGIRRPGWATMSTWLCSRRPLPAGTRRRCRAVRSFITPTARRPCRSWPMPASPGSIRPALVRCRSSSARASNLLGRKPEDRVAARRAGEC